LWSTSGREVLFSINDHPGLNRKAVGGGDTATLWKADETVYPAQELKDGSILFHNYQGHSVWLLHPGTGANPQSLFDTEYRKDSFHLSADERWISYSANETGLWDVYVAEFPSFKERIQVSNNGGAEGLWRRDAKELFYLGLDGSMNSVRVKAGAQRIEASPPEKLFGSRIRVRPTSDQYAVTGDGKRFLLLEPAAVGETPWKVILNCPATLSQAR
jgi:hypothetical protein